MSEAWYVDLIKEFKMKFPPYKRGWIAKSHLLYYPNIGDDEIMHLQEAFTYGGPSQEQLLIYFRKDDGKDFYLTDETIYVPDLTQNHFGHFTSFKTPKLKHIKTIEFLGRKKGKITFEMEMNEINLDFTLYKVPSYIYDMFEQFWHLFTKFDIKSKISRDETVKGHGIMIKKAKKSEESGNYIEAFVFYKSAKADKDVERIEKKLIEEAKVNESKLNYTKALDIYELLGLDGDELRMREIISEEGKTTIEQTVVHGDYVDDRDTIVQDSVISKSSIGAGGDDKFARLEKLTEMKKEGLIDAAEFQQMKKEILGK